MSKPAPSGKIVSVQLLRAIAALAVALAHIFWAFADNIGEGFGLAADTTRISQSAVMLFFIISGYIMVVSSRGLFGTKGARRIFWTRRAVRILPPYWLATLALLGVFVLLIGRGVDPAEFALSLALIPYWSADGGESLRAVPFLWVGWTLFFEMVFYLFFGLLIARGRSAAIAISLAGLVALVVAGRFVGPDNAFLFTVTRPVLLMFVPGIVLALLRVNYWSVPVWLRVTALIGCAACVMLVPKPEQSSAMGFDYLVWCGLPAILFAVAVLGGELRLPFPRLINAAGDISYALYLLHVPVAWAWIWFYPKLPLFTAGPLDFFLTASAVAIVVSWGFYCWIERPLTASLNQRFGAARG